MVDRVGHQVKVHLPPQIATAIDQQAAKNGLRPGTLSRMLIRRWLAKHRTDPMEFHRLLATRQHAAADRTVKLLLTDDEWRDLRFLGNADDDVVSRFVARVLCTCVTNLQGSTKHSPC